MWNSSRSRIRRRCCYKRNQNHWCNEWVLKRIWFESRPYINFWKILTFLFRLRWNYFEFKFWHNFQLFGRSDESDSNEAGGNDQSDCENESTHGSNTDLIQQDDDSTELAMEMRLADIRTSVDSTDEIIDFNNGNIAVMNRQLPMAIHCIVRIIVSILHCCISYRPFSYGVKVGHPTFSLDQHSCFTQLY